MEPPWEECSKQREAHVQRPWGEKLVCGRRLEGETLERDRGLGHGSRRGRRGKEGLERQPGWGAG